MKHAGTGIPSARGDARVDESTRRRMAAEAAARHALEELQIPHAPAPAGVEFELDAAAQGPPPGMLETPELADPLEIVRALPPLKRAQAFARYSIEIAEQAEWQASAARQAVAADAPARAAQALERARGHVSGAQFLSALMTAALESHGRGAGADGHRVPSELRRLVGRSHAAVDLAASVVQAAERELAGQLPAE